jgi:hypothetical protein
MKTDDTYGIMTIQCDDKNTGQKKVHVCLERLKE